MRPRSLLVATLALPVLLSCRRVPATVNTDEDPASTRDAPPRVFVEAGPDTGNASKLAAPLSAEAESLYRCWFESPYEYMFAGGEQPLEIDGRSYGMLMAGISGILYYGDFNECAGRLVGDRPSSYSDFGPIEVLAGVSATIPNPKLPFDSVNPEIVWWARAELLPGAHESIDGIPVQLAYDRVFRRFFRVMGESLFWLLEAGPIAQEASTYLRDVSRGDDGIDWLEGQYGAIPPHGGWADGTTMSAPMAAGFWLRRELDGSLEPCWHGLRDVLERYDVAWLGDLRARYPKATALVDQLPDTMPASPAAAPGRP